MKRLMNEHSQQQQLSEEQVKIYEEGNDKDKMMMILGKRTSDDHDRSLTMHKLMRNYITKAWKKRCEILK